MEARAQGISFERIELDRELPFRCFFNSLGYVGSHWHAELELVLQVRGEITISTSSGPVTLSPGDIFLANPFETHSLVSRDTNNLELALQIDLADPVLLPRTSSNRRFRSSSGWPDSLSDNVRDHMVSIADELAIRAEGFGLACLSSTASLIRDLIRTAGDATPNQASNQDYPVWLDHVTTVIGYLRDRFDHPISLENVADHVGLSRFHVSHLVKQATGMSLQENLALIRANHAIHLMFTTDARLVDIALDAGFSHLKYFNKYFARLYGTTPSAVRDDPEWHHAITHQGAGMARPPSVVLVNELRSALNRRGTPAN